MHCGCKSATTEKLFYRISEDLKIYPEHKNYVHDIYCCRYKDEMGDVSRQTAYVINDDDGEVTVTDRFVQQAIAQVLTPIYEEQFHDHSYGFRPNRCAQQAFQDSIKMSDEKIKEANKITFVKELMEEAV